MNKPTSKIQELHVLNEMLGYCYRTFEGFVKNGEINKEVFMNYVVILEDVLRRLKELYKL